jgi:hypothetical protein
MRSSVSKWQVPLCLRITENRIAVSTAGLQATRDVTTQAPLSFDLYTLKLAHRPQRSAAMHIVH